jgi:hypothetical protein
MISAQVIKGIEELLGQRGVQIRNGERMGDAVARELGISPNQAERLLETLHDGGTVEEAVQRAGITGLAPAHSELLNDLARKIGTALGRVAR